jgi:hypothetical protein
LHQTSDTQAFELNRRKASFSQTTFESVIITDKMIQETEKPLETGTKQAGSTAQPNFEILKSLAQSEVYTVESSQRVYTYFFF